MGADGSLPELAVDGERRPNSSSSEPSGSSRRPPTMTSPLRNGRSRCCSSHGWTVMSRARVERDQVDSLAASRNRRHRFERSSCGATLRTPLRRSRRAQVAVVEREVGRFRRQQRCGDVGQRSGRDDKHVGAQAGESDRHAGLDAPHQDAAGEDRAAADRHSREQQQRAGLAPAKILQRQAAEQKPDTEIRRASLIAPAIAGAKTVATAASQRARTRVLHVLELGRDDDAVMMAAVARQYAQQFICLGIDDGDAARQPLEAAERTPARTCRRR